VKRRVEVEGTAYELDFQPVRTSLSDAPTMLWGFEVQVRRDGQPVGIKTCFVGRVGVHADHPEALEGPIDALLPVLHDRAEARIRERLAAGEPGDEILFA
jgi:hypothetical protein